MSCLVSSPFEIYCTTTCPCYERRRNLRVTLMSSLPELEITKLLSHHLTSSSLDQRTAAIALCKMLPRIENPFPEGLWYEGNDLPQYQKVRPNALLFTKHGFRRWSNAFYLSDKVPFQTLNFAHNLIP